MNFHVLLLLLLLLLLLFEIVSGYAQCCYAPRLQALNQVSARGLHLGLLK
jgi:hypothetical protein